MQLDVATLLAAGSLTSALAGAVIYLCAGHAKHHYGLTYLIGAMLALAVALAVLALTGMEGGWPVQAIGYTLVAASALLYRLAADELKANGEADRKPLVVFAIVLLVVWVALIADVPDAVRSVLFALGVAAVLLLPLPALRAANGVHWPQWIAAAAFAIAALAFVVRGVSELYGAPANVLLTLALLGLAAAAPIAFLLMLREDELKRLGTLDGLTEVFNRGGFFDQTERVLALAKRRGLACSMMLIDLDHFNSINATRGYRAGDTVLKQFVARAKSLLRREDAFGRTGSDEFAMLLFATPAAGAQGVARRLQAALLAHPPRVAGVTVPFTGSYGVSEWRPEQPLELIELMQRANRALNEAKARGRDCVVSIYELEP